MDDHLVSHFVYLTNAYLNRIREHFLDVPSEIIVYFIPVFDVFPAAFTFVSFYNNATIRPSFLPQSRKYWIEKIGP
jgi:hypothetical protein